MALRLIEGFEHYFSAAELTAGKWSSSGGSGTVALNPAGSARGGSVLELSGDDTYLLTTLDNQTTWIVGFRYKVS